MHEFEIGIKIVNPQFPVFVSASAVALGFYEIFPFTISVELFGFAFMLLLFQSSTKT